MCDSVIQQQHRLKWNVKKTKPSHCHLQEKQGLWWAGRVFFFLSLTQMHNHVLRPCLAGRHLIELCHHADYFLLQMINCVQGVLGNSAHLFLCCSQQVTNGRGDNMTNLSGLQFNVNYMSIKITFAVLATGCTISAAIVAQTGLTGTLSCFITSVSHSWWWFGESLLTSCGFATDPPVRAESDNLTGSIMSALRNFLFNCAINAGVKSC